MRMHLCYVMCVSSWSVGRQEKLIGLVKGTVLVVPTWEL